MRSDRAYLQVSIRAHMHEVRKLYDERSGVRIFLVAGGIKVVSKNRKVLVLVAGMNRCLGEKKNEEGRGVSTPYLLIFSKEKKS